MDFESFVLAAVTDDLAAEPTARAAADAVEFRMDLADAPGAALAEYDGALPVIATNRVVGEGGEAPAGADRLDALAAAAEHDRVGAIDIELDAIEDGDAAGVVKHARRHDTAVIVSVHDFEATPPLDTVRDYLVRAADVGDVGKLAVTATGPGDVLGLLRATWDATTAGRRVATMAMGPAGQHSRAVAPLYGSRIGYAPVADGRATAPGQYELGTLRRLVDELRGPEGGEAIEGEG